MSQFNYLNFPCQAFNAHYLEHQKWVRDQLSVTAQIRSAADENYFLNLKQILSNPTPFYLLGK